jgi:hypothetical protein
VTNEVVTPPDTPLPPGPEVQDTTPTPDTTAQPAPEQPATAPEASTTQIVTEADKPAAPTASPRPRARPKPPAPAPAAATPTPPAPTPTPPAPATPDASAIDSAVADALADTPSAPSGPPLTSGEKDGLRIAVSACWNLGSASTDAMNTTVVVMVDMAADGKPTNIELVSSDGPTPEATNIAYEAARRAVLRCGIHGYKLPADKYDQWSQIEMTFNPGNMRIR